MPRNPVSAVVIGALITLSSGVLAQEKILSIEPRTAKDGVEVRVRGERLTRPKVTPLYGGQAWIYEFRPLSAPEPKRLRIGQAGVESVHYAWFTNRPPVYRLVVRLEKPGRPVLEASPEGWVIRFGLPVDAAKPSSGTSGSPPASSDAELMRRAAEEISRPPATKASRPEREAAPRESEKRASAGDPSDQQAMADAERILSDAQSARARGQSAAPLDVDPTSPPRTLRGTRPAGESPASPAVQRPASPPPAAPPKTPERPLSLQFDETNVTQILRALAVQAGVNIVTTPGVQGTLTIDLQGVSLSEALDVVCALANLRYGRIGNTIVVATPDQFELTMRRIGGQGPGGPLSTIVVPIFSGQGPQIKAAALSAAGEGESFEITLPSDLVLIGQKTQVQPGGGTGPQAGAQGGEERQGTEVTVTSVQSEQNRPSDAYVLIVGSQRRIEEVAEIVRRIDQQICRALGIEVPASSDIVQTTYTVKGGSAKALLEAVAGKDGRRVGQVEVSATPEDSRSQQVISLRGRANEVASLIETLAQLDSTGEAETEVMIYEVKHLDPRALREEIIAAVPGIRATIAPNSAGTPALYREGGLRQQAREVAGAQGEQAGAPPAGGGGGGQPPTVERGSAPPEGLAQPFQGLEPVAVPMRLILRGTARQLEEAQAYLQRVDVAPRQIALELRVVELSREEALRAGIDWNILTGGSVKLIRLNNAQPSPPDPANTVGINISGRDVRGNVVATLDRTLDANRIIARPNLRAIDGRETALFVGDVVRYIESIQSTQNGVTVTTNSVRVGVNLAVLPRIGSDGRLTLDIRPSVTFLRGFTPVPGGGQLPQTSERVAQSTIAMQSGDTIAIGGLIQEQDVKSLSGIPVLMDLPIVGNLFKRQTNTRQRREIVIFLSARVIEEGAEAPPAELGSRERSEPGGTR